MGLIARMTAATKEQRRLRELRERTQVMAPLQPGDRIRRIKDGRVFKLTLIKFGGDNGGVFTAVSDDGKWGDWGGGLMHLKYGETFEMAEASK